MKVRDIMTSQVVSVALETTVDQIVALMLKHRISALPVLDDKGAIVGIVSEGDLMRRVEGANTQARSWWLSLFSRDEDTAADFVKLRGRYAKDVMTRDVKTVGPHTPVGEAARLLERHRIKRVPVVENGALVGLVSRANLLRGLAALPQVHLEANTDIDAKRDIVEGALAAVPGINPAHLNIVVTDDRVDVWGIAGSDAEEEAAKVALENIDGLGEVSVQLGRVPDYAWGI